VAPAAREGWGGPDLRSLRARALGVALGWAALPGGVVAAVLWAAAGCAAAVVTVALYALAGLVWSSLQGARALRAAGAQPLDPSREPRLANLAAGLATRLQLKAPALWVLPSGGPNALVCRARGRACVAVTRAALDRYSRTEVEALVAHCLVRLWGSALAAESVVAALGGRVPGLPPLVGAAADVAAAALTRYPPALAAALSKTAPPARPGPFWFAAAGPSHEPPARRVALLEQL
jgi:hypothetical protein